MHGRLGGYGERWSLVPQPGEPLVPAARFLDPDVLEPALQHLAANLGTTNLRAVTSQWHKHYSAALLQPVLAAMTVAGIGLDGSMDNTAFTFDAKGFPRKLVLSNTAPVLVYGPRWDGAPAVCGLPDLQRVVADTVRERHLAPLIDRLRTVTGIPRRILWTNVANVVADLYDKLAGRPETCGAAAEDRAALLDSSADLLGGGANPLFGLVRYEPVAVPGLPEQVRCRNACCQRYSLPGFQACTTCPRLSLEQRLAAMEKKQ